MTGGDLKDSFRTAVYSVEFVLASLSGALLARCDWRGLKRFIPEGRCLFGRISTSEDSWLVVTGGNLKDSFWREDVYSVEFPHLAPPGPLWPEGTKNKYSYGKVFIR